MISSYQNLSGGALQFAYGPVLGAANPAYSNGAADGQQHLRSVYEVVAAAAAAQQQGAPYRPAEHGFQQRPPSPYAPPQPTMYHEPSRQQQPEPPNRVRPAPQLQPPPQQRPPPHLQPSPQQRPPVQYTRVEGGVPGGKTSLHAVIDYDEGEENSDYYDEYSHSGVTPIQGPIYLKNDSVPVVPLLGYQKVNNGSLLQIPVFWTALSFALGYEIGGDVIRGTPCIKRNHQLFCPTAGKSYPVDRIDRFIDENKALMKRMYGDFEMMENGPFPKAKRSTARKKRQNTSFPDDQSKSNKLPTKGQPPDSGRVDSCESKVEVVTPYWASNSVGKTRAIVNTEHFEQAIHQEVCSKTETSRCSRDCGCEQKYKWHRLLAYDPDNDCKGIFMDWFLFPSCCVCRCDSIIPNSV